MSYSVIALHAPSKPINIGGALRAASCFDAAVVVVSGGFFKTEAADTTKFHRSRPLLVVDDVMEAIPYDCVPVAVEYIEDAHRLEAYEHPPRAFYVFGPESGSLPQRILNKCRDIIIIPSDYCLNLAAAVNIVLYDRRSKRG